ncbi:MAG: hypothetical protein GXO63_00895 [Candidatus Micrarchaeota archaeon]|nr:hypothetical protein [Candidatus Micrarchaeota archaeon]
MKFVCFVRDWKKAEEVLKKDDTTSRGSIVLRDAKNFGIEKNGYFLFFKGSEEAVKRARELVNDFTEACSEEVLKKVEEEFEKEDEKAASGFGDIFG